MPLSILLIGAGPSSLLLTLLLTRALPTISLTLIERAPSLRASDLQLDFKAQGTPLITRLGLMDAMRMHRVHETGAIVVGARGETLASYGIKTDAGTEGLGGLTNEVEIMRGDMVRVLYEAGLAKRKELEERGVQEGGLEYRFGTTVKGVVQDPSGDGVRVTFSDGREERFDLVVGGDGQNSRTRGMAFGEEASAASVKELGYQVAYFSIPRGEGDGGVARMYLAAKSRAVVARNGDRPRTQVYMFTSGNMERIKESYKKSAAEQKAVWRETFTGAGWETERFLKGMQEAEDFYSHQLVQIKLPALYKGRVALIGDAGYCPSVMTGKGTTAAFIGAYVLAGELARRPSDVDGALEAYNEAMKEPVRLSQIIDSAMGLPSSSLAVWFIRNSIWAASTLKIDKLYMKLMPEKKEKTGLEAWPLPEYPELDLAE
ncbi:FAD/NAD(P)-binding domain-containing protein [Bimuria novae-zelandiae CBS 107.79]|uniref:FAD/NAD(P)-binding domain-containing protein n=1 Tax=Bimuria novae-zelandiae CBS 107.79 TaxID=1447943 RepID=A0A6A5VQ21_9PLEO|nr:FAD/NAD(P)-binding domain-containing protein [Bimuria novae-zelandiae CBS 107.79]